MVSQVLGDEFASEEYAPQHKSWPYLQLLNNENPDQSGFFISVDNAEAVEFEPSDDWQPFEKRFRSNNGKPTTGFRSLTARMAILRRSPLFMFTRSTGKLLGPFDSEQYDSKIHILKTKYLVYLVGKNKKLLHNSPLQFTTKGSVCGSFGDHYKLFRKEMDEAYGVKRGDRFFALSVFAVRLSPQLKGEKEQSWVCSIVEHGVPKADSEQWKAFFLGYDLETKEKLLADFEANPHYGQPNHESSSNSYDLTADTCDGEVDF